MSEGSNGAWSRMYSSVINPPVSHFLVRSTTEKIVPVWPGARLQFLGSSIEKAPVNTFGSSKFCGLGCLLYHGSDVPCAEGCANGMSDASASRANRAIVRFMVGSQTKG